MTQYKGWIACPNTPDFEASKTMLENFGIKVEEYDRKTEVFEDCEVSSDALDALDEYWGQFFWGLAVQRIVEVG